MSSHAMATPGTSSQAVLAHEVAQRLRVHQSDRAPSADRGVGTGRRVPDRDEAGGHRGAVDDELTLTVLDAGHHRHVGDRLGVHPVRDEWERRTTSVHVSTSRHRRTGVSRALAMSPTPQVPLSAGRVSVDTESYACSGGPKRGGSEPSADRKCHRVVHEPAVVPLFADRTGADGVEPHGGGRPPTAGVHDQVGAVLGAVVGHDSRHVRGCARRGAESVRTPRTATPRCTVTPGVVATTRSTAASTTGRRPVKDWWRSSPSRRPTADLLGHRFQRVEAQRAVGVERGCDRGQVAFDDVAEPGQEVVDHAELVDPAAQPLVPRRVGRAGRRLRVAFEHGHRCARRRRAASPSSARRARRRRRRSRPSALRAAGDRLGAVHHHDDLAVVGPAPQGVATVDVDDLAR